ncbi:hypothetical protein HMI55_004804, partial [Coelomomyces lativittatus]
PCGYINILINNVLVKALWDSGAEVNVMQERKARQLGINITEGPTNIQGFDMECANDEVVLGRPFEMAFQTTSAVLADGSYTGTVQNHDEMVRPPLG